MVIVKAMVNRAKLKGMMVKTKLWKWLMILIMKAMTVVRLQIMKRPLRKLLPVTMQLE